MPVDVNGLAAEIERQGNDGRALEEDMRRLTLGPQGVYVERGETGRKVVSDNEESLAPSESTSTESSDTAARGGGRKRRRLG